MDGRWKRVRGRPRSPQPVTRAFLSVVLGGDSAESSRAYALPTELTLRYLARSECQAGRSAGFFPHASGNGGGFGHAWEFRFVEIIQ